MSQHRPDDDVSAHLKHLHRAQGTLQPPAFGIDDIVRGGRRRRRHRTIATGAATLAAAVVLIGGVVATGSLDRGNGPGPGPAAPPSASAAPSLPPLVRAGDAAVKYSQTGDAVTVAKNGRTIATVTLTGKTFAATSAHVELTVTVEQPFSLDPRLFVLYDSKGGENSPDAQDSEIRVDTGSRTVALDYTDIDNPEAIGWVPQDGEGGAAVWQ